VRKEQDEFVEKQVDEVKLEEKGWKGRYYSVKLHNAVTPQELAHKYFIGLAWVLKFYFEVGHIQMHVFPCL
jgi:5'-3' exonuclease